MSTNISTNISVFLGIMTILFWVLAYICIIWRGVRDHSFGMPVTALSANISWEFIYSFIYQPFTDYIHYLSIVWFLFDIPIAIQCFTYGTKDFKTEFIRKRFPLIFIGNVIVCFCIMLIFFNEFNDWAGAYTGFGINLMMSILFICMLIRRDDILGQSIYIAFFKWLGTLLAFLSIAFDAYAKLDIPIELPRTFIEIIAYKDYPLTPLVKVLYFFTFIIDVLYIAILYGYIKKNKINAWTRF